MFNNIFGKKVTDLQFKKIHKKIFIYVYEIVKHNTNKINTKLKLSYYWY
jgi:hypothetical protein